MTDDDELELAYYLFTDTWAKTHRDKTEYLLHDEWRLPSDTGDDQASFSPGFNVTALGDTPQGTGTTWIQCFTFYDSESLGDLQDSENKGLVALPGLRLPDLPAWLRQATVTERWSLELRALRAMLPNPSEPHALQHALRGIDTIDIESFYQRPEGSWELVRSDLEKHPPKPNQGDCTKSLMSVSSHFAQLCSHVNDWAGYQQWFLYDDVWAATHSELARSLMRYGLSWDPFQSNMS